MSDAHPPTWPALSLIQRRVLGVLIEKQKTTPDVYPMSLNGLVTGCNQKSNRDPVLSLTDVDVEDSLIELQKLALVTRVESGRVEKWRHLLYEQWHVGKSEIAVLAELLLRGPQTEGDLRTRVSRMDPVEDLDSLRAVLQPLVQRRLVAYLTPEGRRGTVVTHGFHDAPELERLKSRHTSAVVDGSVAVAPLHAGQPYQSVQLAPKLERLEAGYEERRQTVWELQTRLATLTDQLRSLREALGVKE